LYDFITHCYGAFQAIVKQEKLPIICGGTGLYLDAIIRGLIVSKKRQGTPMLALAITRHAVTSAKKYRFKY
jgi:tRNA A37 N6-isopentenylltransferase MiaA